MKTAIKMASCGLITFLVVLACFVGYHLFQSNEINEAVAFSGIFAGLLVLAAGYSVVYLTVNEVFHG